MENIAVQADQLRALEAAKAQEREATLGLLETQASEMFKQGSDLRQFADAKVDALRAELATAVENEANLRKALALGKSAFLHRPMACEVLCKMQSKYTSHCNRSTRFAAML